MEYKVLIKVYVPEIEDSYEAYIPINKTIAEISLLLNQLVSSVSKIYPSAQNVFLYNRHTGLLYSRDLLIRDTDIKNGAELVMIS